MIMITGRYIGLRAIERGDLPQMLQWRNIPQFRRYFREYRELNFMNQESWFENIILKDSNTIMFSVIDKRKGTLLGACGLCYINWINRNADFSLYIGAADAYIDKKYAPDAGKALLQYGFDELNLHRVYAEVFDFDTPKQALMKQLGFTLEGTHRETHWSEGKWNNSMLYGILKNENPESRV
jgi:RimJ/RimL family protein N-acetyltransferase